MRVPSRAGRVLILAVGICLASCQEAPEPSFEWVTGSVPSADGVAISYQTAGEGPVSVVFVHGWLCDRGYWRDQLEEFAQVHRVVALDLAGHGDSGLNRDDWTFPAFGEDVAAVINGLGLERVVLVGHSMGGPVIVEAARIAPQKVIGLVGVDTLQNPDAPGMPPEAMQAFLAPFEENFSDAVRNLVSAAMFVPQSDPNLKEWIVEDMASAPPDVGVGALRSNMLWPTTTRSEALAALRAPVRLINSPLFPTDSAATDRHGMEVVIMDGVGHFAMMENPETFNSLLSSAIADFANRD
jgi:pimeloyl-ACP methyl ester carboxylesterase